MNKRSTARLLSLIAAGGLFLFGGALILAAFSLTGGTRSPATRARWGTSNYDPVDDALAGTFPASDPPAFQVPESVPPR